MRLPQGCSYQHSIRQHDSAHALLPLAYYSLQVKESPEDWSMVKRVDVHGYKSPTVVHPYERRFSPSYYTDVRDVSACQSGETLACW